MATIGWLKTSMPEFERFYLDDRLARVAESIESLHRSVRAERERWATATARVWAELPKRGWYLSGQEPAELIVELSDLISAKKWEKVDESILAHLPKFKTKELKEWMRMFDIPDYCFNRVLLFLASHESREYETATHLGIPLIDEIAHYLHDGKSLTTKRARNRRRPDQSKPELAFETANGKALSRFHKGFVESFGSLQEEPKMARLSDENYWNRHAIVHGMVRRSMGAKDSAKCLMAIAFLIYAFNDGRGGSNGD